MSWKRASDTLCRALFCCLLAVSGALADSPPHQVRDINRARIPESSNPGYLGTLNGRVLFRATDRQGAGLWSTDGASTGTKLIKRMDVFPQRNFPGAPMFVVQNGGG
jgi:ELWxxDGT repeat protein